MSPEVSNILGMAVAAAVPFAIGAVAGALTMVVTKVRGWLKMKTTETDRANMEKEIAACLGVGVRVALPQIMSRGPSALADPNVLALITREAATYLRERFPDRADQIVASAPDHLSDNEAIRQTIGARLPNVISQMAPPAALGPPLEAAKPVPAILPPDTPIERLQPS